MAPLLVWTVMMLIAFVSDPRPALAATGFLFHALFPFFTLVSSLLLALVLSVINWVPRIGTRLGLHRLLRILLLAILAILGLPLIWLAPAGSYTAAAESYASLKGLEIFGGPAAWTLILSAILTGMLVLLLVFVFSDKGAA